MRIGVGQYGEDDAHHGRLAGSGAARQNADIVCCSRSNRVNLELIELEVGALYRLLNLVEHLPALLVGNGGFLVGEVRESCGHGLLVEPVPFQVQPV